MSVRCSSLVAAAHQPGLGGQHQLVPRVGAVEHDARRLVRAVDAALGPAQEGPQPSGHLLHLERLGEVVVGADLEPGDDVVGVVAGADDDDRDVAAAPYLADAVEPGHPAEHEVDQHDVGVDLGERPQGLLGAGGLRDLVPLVLQGQPEHGTDAVVVLDEEHPHGHATMLAQAPSALRPPVRGTGGFVIRPQRAGRYVRKVRCSL